MQLFKKVTWWIRKSFLPGFLVLIIALMGFVAYDYFKQPHDLWGGHWVGCGNFDKYSVAGENHQSTLALEITNQELDKFRIAGELSLNPAVYRMLSEKKANLFITLESLRSPTNGISIPQFLELDINNAVPSWNGNKIIKVKETQLYVFGRMVYFPFDEYRIGFRPKLNVSYSKTEPANVFPLDAIITNIRLPKTMVATKAHTWNDFVQNVALQTYEKDTKYKVDECAVIVERSGWYKSLIALLLLLLITPAIYLVYRPEDNPGVDLIAVILGVAAIRQFFLGSLMDWQLSWIDIVFAGIAVLTAMIPLIHIVKKQLRW